MEILTVWQRFRQMILSTVGVTSIWQGNPVEKFEDSIEA
jgi:hypothetical protein